MVEGPPTTPSAAPTGPSGAPPRTGLGTGPSLPHRLGDFELLREIGRGGMGIVYEARQVSLGRRVALKILPSTLGLDAAAVARFAREARAAAALHHPNIVPVHATGEADGHHYYAMDLIEGEALSIVLEQARGRGTATTGPGSGGASDAATSGRAWFDSAARRLASVADGLHEAHRLGIVHRDVKPANLMLSSDGRLCLTDFGLARIGEEPGLTLSGAMLGTPAYMSPEQVAAGRAVVDHRTDVYSLGAVLYELLTLRRPFEGPRDEVMGAILAKEPRPPRRINPRVPVDLETICLMAMEKDPDRRYPTAAALAEDLRRYLSRGLVTARRAGIVRRTGKAMRRHALITTMAVAAILLVAAGGLAASFRQQQRAATAHRAVSEAALLLREGRPRDGLAIVERALAEGSRLDALHILRARLLMRLARAGDAMAEARTLLKARPDDWRAHLILASAAGSSMPGTHSPEPDAAVHLAAVEADAPETADVYFLRALMAEPVAAQLRLLDRALELDPAHVEALLERLNRYRWLKDFPAALGDADRIMAILPRSAQGRRMRAWVHHGARDVAAARQEIDRAIALDPADGFNLLMRATLLDEAGRYEEALADLDRAIALEPDNPPLLVRRSLVHGELGDRESAVEDARRAVAAAPDDRPARVALLEALAEAGDVEALALAIGEARERIRSWNDPREQARVLQETAVLEHARGDTRRAYEDVDQAIALDPGHDLGYRVRAGLRRRDGDTAGALADCERAAACALELPGDLLARGQWLANFCRLPGPALDDSSRAIALAPHWADAHRWRGVLHFNERRWDEALADLDRAVSLAPGWTDPYYNRGRVHAGAERFAAAVADFAELRRRGSDGMNVRWEEAKALSRLGRVEEALASLEAAERLQPREELNPRRRGFVLLWEGRMAEARAAFRRAVDMSPQSARALQTRAYADAYAGAPCPGVAADLDRALEMAPQDEWIWREVALIHADVFAIDCPQQFRADLALDLARRAVRFDTMTPEFHETLGLVLYRAGEARGARDAARAAAELYPQSSASTLFLLALTSRRLGFVAEARDQFRAATARMEATYPNDPRLVRRRREAAQAVGL